MDKPDAGTIVKRVQDIKILHREHFDNLRLLDQYSRQRPQNWFPESKVSLPSVVRSNIRAAEKTAIAFLTGNDPKFRGSRNASEAGTSATNGDVEQIARAIFHLIDKQSEFNLLQEPVSKAIRRGEVIFQYGWLDEEQRGYDDAKGTAKRFPIFIKVLDRLRVYYELSPFGEPLEVYHEYRTTVSQLVAEFPAWDAGKEMDPATKINVIDAWVGKWHAVLGDTAFVKEPTDHGYGDSPPFVIERCAVEDVADDAGEEYAVPVMCGTPLCLDMLNPYQEACIASSLKRTMVENAAIGSWLIETTPQSAPFRGLHGESASKGATLKMGPGTVTPLYPGEKISPAPVHQLPPALESYLNEAEGELAALGFSPALLRGEVPGDPSGYSIEQVRQAAMARLQPYKASIGRAFSRLWEKLFVLLADNWAPEWANGIPAQGNNEGTPFSMIITEEMVSPPPDHIEVALVPMLPQNTIAMWQAYNTRVQQGTMDPLEAMGEMGSPDPQASWDNALIHRQQWTNPMAQQAAVQSILRARSGQPDPLPPGAVPTGNVLPALPPDGALVGPPPGPVALPPPPQGRTGPPPAERSQAAPLGVLGAPNLPIPTVPRPNTTIQRP